MRNKRLHGFKFRRQHPISNFVADFYCAEKKLIVELDGSIHNSIEHLNYDEERSNFLKNHQIKVLRFRNGEVKNNMEKVLRKILKTLENVYLTPFNAPRFAGPPLHMERWLRGKVVKLLDE